MKFGKEYDLGMVGGMLVCSISAAISMAINPLIFPEKTYLDFAAVWFIFAITQFVVYKIKRDELKREATK